MATITTAKITNETYVSEMKSGYSWLACVELSFGNQLTPSMKSKDRRTPSTVPATTNCATRLIGALPGHAARRGSYTHERPPCEPAKSALCASLRYAG